MNRNYRDFLIRPWQESDRTAAAEVIHSVLTQYNLPWLPTGADQNAVRVEDFYLSAGGEFWVVEKQGQVVGTAGYYPVKRGPKAVEIRKMYLLPEVRGQGLGKYLLTELEKTIAARGFQEIWIETASILKEAVQLYESSGFDTLRSKDAEILKRV